MTSREDLAGRIAEFKEQGYTLFENVYDRVLMDKWIAKHTELQENGVRSNVGHPVWWFKDTTEHAPTLMLPAVANPLILDFAERIMGPCVQLDNLTLAGFPSVAADTVVGKTSGWHRDRWGQVPRGETYERPHAINAICYLQDLTPEYGPLRVIPGSHRKPMILPPDQRSLPHPDEVVIPMKAGDVVVIHNCLIHSGTPNTSGKTRYFFSIFYNLTWLKVTDNHNGPNVQQIIANAKERNDLRTMRLFGVDPNLEKRANSGFLDWDEERWEQWIQEEQKG